MPEPQDDIVSRLADACRVADAAALRALLDDDAVAVCDSGGFVPAPPGPVVGADDVAVLVAGLLCGLPDTDLTVESVNGGAGIAIRRAGRALAVVSVRSADGRVIALWIVLNPAKIRAFHR
jgi:RNA polymerase sigma-70 factor (ECF subfamily)